MTLTKLLEGIIVVKLYHALYGKMAVTQDLHIAGIQYDSRKIQQGEMFVAMRGQHVDGHNFISQAIARGARVVVVENDNAAPDSFFLHAGVAKLVVPDSRKALALLSGNFYDHPSKRLRLVGITGTNGKTTTTHLIHSVLQQNGEKAGLIGTIEYKTGNEAIPATHTTPESLDLNRLLDTMVRNGCSSAVMEVSSHALVLDRVYGVDFAVAGFTNLTQDHLDFHGTMNSYFEAKRILFDGLSSSSWAVTNADDPHGHVIVDRSRASVLKFGFGPGADVQATKTSFGIDGTQITITYKDDEAVLKSPLMGRFNTENILAAFSTGIALGLPAHQIIRGIENVKAVRGRFEQVHSLRGWTAVIDYAHTPDALENCLKTIRAILPQGARIITVFGCGGDRDRGKRPLMGKIVSALSDAGIITSDNPRTEDPASIIDEIRKGMSGTAAVSIEPDRRKAIRLGLTRASAGDVVLIAGKGHEDYQIVGATKTAFDDRAEVEQFIRETA